MRTKLTAIYEEVVHEGIAKGLWQELPECPYDADDGEAAAYIRSSEGSVSRNSQAEIRNKDTLMYKSIQMLTCKRWI